MPEATHWLAVLSLTREDMLTSGPTDAEQAAVMSHWKYLCDQFEQGVVGLVGRTDDRPTPMGIYLLKAGSLDEAISIAQSDPVVVAGVMRVQVRPFLLFMNAAEWAKTP